MLIRLKKSFDEGVEKMRWFSSLMSERMKVELAVIKLMKECDDLEKKRFELVNNIGERVFSLRDRKEANLLEDSRIKEAVRELEKLDERIQDLKNKASEIGKVE